MQTARKPPPANGDVLFGAGTRAAFVRGENGKPGTILFSASLFSKAGSKEEQKTAALEEFGEAMAARFAELSAEATGEDATAEGDAGARLRHLLRKGTPATRDSHPDLFTKQDSDTAQVRLNGKVVEAVTYATDEADTKRLGLATAVPATRLLGSTALTPPASPIARPSSIPGEDVTWLTNSAGVTPTAEELANETKLQNPVLGATVSRSLLEPVSTTVQRFREAAPEDLARAIMGITGDIPAADQERFDAIVAYVKEAQGNPSILGIRDVSFALSSDDFEASIALGDKTALPVEITGAYVPSKGVALVSAEASTLLMRGELRQLVAEETFGGALTAQLKEKGLISDEHANSYDLGSAIGGVLEPSETLEGAVQSGLDNERKTTNVLVDGEVTEGYAGVLGWLKKQGNNIANAASSTWDGIQSIGEGVHQGVQYTKEGLKYTQEGWEWLKDRSTEWAQAAGRFLVSAEGWTLEQAAKFGEGLKDAILAGASNAWEAIKYIIDNIPSLREILEMLVKGVLRPVVNSVKDSVMYFGADFRRIAEGGFIRLQTLGDLSGRFSAREQEDYNVHQKAPAVDGYQVETLMAHIPKTGSTQDINVDRTGQTLSDIIDTPKVGSALQQMASIFTTHSDTLDEAYFRQVFGPDVTEEQKQVIRDGWVAIAKYLEDGEFSPEDARALQDEFNLRIGSFGSALYSAEAFYTEDLSDGPAIFFGDHLLAHTTAASGHRSSHEQQMLASVAVEEFTHFLAAKAGIYNGVQPTEHAPEGDVGRMSSNFLDYARLGSDEPIVPDEEAVRTERGAAKNDLFEVRDGVFAKGGIYAYAGAGVRVVASLSFTGGYGSAVFLHYGFHKHTAHASADTHGPDHTGAVTNSDLEAAMRRGDFYVLVGGGWAKNFDPDTKFGSEFDVIYTNNGDWGKEGTHNLRVIGGYNAAASILDLIVRIYGEIGVGAWVGFDTKWDEDRDKMRATGVGAGFGGYGFAGVGVANPKPKNGRHPNQGSTGARVMISTEAFAWAGIGVKFFNYQGRDGFEF